MCRLTVAELDSSHRGRTVVVYPAGHKPPVRGKIQDVCVTDNQKHAIVAVGNIMCSLGQGTEIIMKKRR